MKFLKSYETFESLKFYEMFEIKKKIENFEIFVNGIFSFSMMSNASIGNVNINIYGDNFKNP